MSGLDGFAQMESKLRAVLEAATAEAVRGGLLAGEHILGISRSRVPIEEGTLERSGRVSLVEGDGRVRVAVSYGSPAGVGVGGLYQLVSPMKYAVRQHEDMSLRHDSGRQAKFLESALADGSKEARQIIAAAVGDAFKGA